MSTADRDTTPVWRFEITNPHMFTDWRPVLKEFTEDQIVAAQELVDELNRINAPVKLRIVRYAN